MLPRVRAAGIALVLVGGLLLAYAFTAEPEPTAFVTVYRSLDGGTAPPERMLAPARTEGVRYDAANDTTLAVFDCIGAHIRCDVAVAIRGDQRAALERDGLMLRPLDDATLARVALDEPLATRYADDVDSRLAATFEMVPRWPGAAARIVGVAAALAGLALAANLPALAAGAGASAAAVAAVLGTNDGGLVIVAQLVLVPLVLVGLGLLLGSLKRPGLRAPGLALLAYAPVVIATLATGTLAFYALQGP